MQQVNCKLIISCSPVP